MGGIEVIGIAAVVTVLTRAVIASAARSASVGGIEVGGRVTARVSYSVCDRVRGVGCRWNGLAFWSRGGGCGGRLLRPKICMPIRRVQRVVLVGCFRLDCCTLLDPGGREEQHEHGGVRLPDHLP